MATEPQATDNRSDAMHVCGEAYQAVVLLANMAGAFDDPSVQALLDNLSDAADGKPLSHETVLPFYPAGWQCVMNKRNTETTERATLERAIKIAEDLADSLSQSGVTPETTEMLKHRAAGARAVADALRKLLLQEQTT